MVWQVQAGQQQLVLLFETVGRYKWDDNEAHLRPERGLLNLRAGMGVFANLRPATVLPQVNCSKFFGPFKDIGCSLLKFFFVGM